MQFILTIVLASTALVGALPHPDHRRHMALHDKRAAAPIVEVRTATEVDVVTAVATATVYGSAKEDYHGHSTSTTTSASSISTPTTQSTTAYSSEASSAASTISLTSSATTSTSSATSTSSLISASGRSLSIAYDPYTDSTTQTCKQESDIKSDIAAIAAKGFSTVRIYGTDCNEHQYVGEAAKDNGLKVILGIYIGDPSEGDGIGSSYVTNQVTDIISTYQSNDWWDVVSLVVYGNEAIFNGYATGTTLAVALTATKLLFAAGGYSGDFTTAETMNIVSENSATLCPVMDVIGANIHPYFNDETTAAEAGTFVVSSLSELSGYCNDGKSVINLETGWPSGPASSADASSGPVAGVSEQFTAVSNIVSSAGSQSVILSWANDMWKTAGEEQYWGVNTIFS